MPKTPLASSRVGWALSFMEWTDAAGHLEKNDTTDLPLSPPTKAPVGLLPGQFEKVPLNTDQHILSMKYTSQLLKKKKEKK